MPPVGPDAAIAAQTQARLTDIVLDALDHAVEKLRFGVVQLTVHDGKVVQLDVTERQRF